MQTNNITIIELKPSEGMHLKHVESGNIFEGTIYLGKFDNAENYEEVSEEEYQEYLIKQQEIPNEEIPNEEIPNEEIVETDIE